MTGPSQGLAGQPTPGPAAGVALRSMRWWDIETLLPLERRLFAGDPPWTAEQFWAELAAPGRAYLVAAVPARDGAVERALIGYAGIAVGDGTAGVLTLAVDPAWRRRGVGGALLDGLLEVSAAARAHEVLLEVRAGNAAAIALYASRGFERLALRRRYYLDGGDGLVLRRRGRLAGSPG